MSSNLTSSAFARPESIILRTSRASEEIKIAPVSELITPLDEKTKRLLTILDEIIVTGSQHNKRVGIGGGFALEIEAANLRGDENLSRNHSDLDFHLLAIDIPFWKGWFSRKGFIIGTNDEIIDKTVPFVAHSPDSTFDGKDPEDCFYIDVYGLKVDRGDFVYSPESGNDEPWMKKWDDAFRLRGWHGRKVYVMDYRDVLRNKRQTAKQMGEPLRDKNHQDHDLFGTNPDLE